jgi:hypothetical protein
VITCDKCDALFATSRALGVHCSHSHRDAEPLGPYELPWHRISEVDRGFETSCWITASGVRRDLPYLRKVLRVKRGQVLMHRCEIFSERNKCVRPDHLVAGSLAENLRHSYEVSAGQRSANVSASQRRRWASAEARERQSSTMSKVYESNQGLRHRVGAAVSRAKAQNRKKP